MSPLDLLNCKIIVFPTEGPFLIADVIIMVYYESIMVFLVEPMQETNVIICRLMLGYETKDLFFLPNDTMLFVCVMENGTIGEGQI